MSERIPEVSMNRSRLAPAILVAVTLAISGRAHAGPPAASTSTLDPVIVTCPAGDVVFTVVTRHADYVPWAEGPVTLTFCGCSGFSLESRTTYTTNGDGCSTWKTPDPDGTSRFPVAAGGACGSPIRIDAGNFALGYRPVASLDQDGDLVVSSADIAIIQSKLGT